LVFWGLTIHPLDRTFLDVTFLYLVVVFVVLAIGVVYARFMIKEKVDKNNFLATSLVGNTGNLGIPLGIALWGESTIPYTSIINIANVLFIYTFSVYFWASNSFSLLGSIKSIVKLPIIWSFLAAILFNTFDIRYNTIVSNFLQMGAYSAISLQLVIFGIFLSDIKIKVSNHSLAIHTNLFKHVILPLVGVGLLITLDIRGVMGAVLLMELMVPLAVNNVNIATLYNSKPLDVTYSILVSSTLFVMLIYFYYQLIKWLMF
jgi:predicted permease